MQASSKTKNDCLQSDTHAELEQIIPQKRKVSIVFYESVNDHSITTLINNLPYQ